jgi:hypothetical protein
MIKFYCFLEGLHYHSRCPVCRKQMEVNDRDLVARLEYPLGHPYQKFAFHIGKSSDDIMYLDPHTEEVEIEFTRNREDYALGSHGTFKPYGYSGQIYTHSTYDGMFYHALTLNCNSCCQYHYTLQLHTDLTERRLVGTYLNSESINVVDGEQVHEIKNIYSTEKTEYACFPKDGSSKKQSMPLIPLNISDPKETVARIKKLLIFS